MTAKTWTDGQGVHVERDDGKRAVFAAGRVWWVEARHFKEGRWVPAPPLGRAAEAEDALTAA